MGARPIPRPTNVKNYLPPMVFSSLCCCGHLGSDPNNFCGKKTKGKMRKTRRNHLSWAVLLVFLISVKSVLSASPAPTNDALSPRHTASIAAPQAAGADASRDMMILVTVMVSSCVSVLLVGAVVPALASLTIATVLVPCLMVCFAIYCCCGSVGLIIAYFAEDDD